MKANEVFEKFVLDHFHDSVAGLRRAALDRTFEEFISDHFHRPPSELKIIIYGLHMQICGGLLDHTPLPVALACPDLRMAGREFGKWRLKASLPEMIPPALWRDEDAVVLVSLLYEYEYEHAKAELQTLGVPEAGIVHARPLAEAMLDIAGTHFAARKMDLSVKALFDSAGRDISSVTYMDVGANNYLLYNNTYLFYKAGASGVLVEANGDFCEILRANRPRDIVLHCGCAPDGAPSAMTYYKTSRAGLNTFMYRDIAAKVERGEIRVVEAAEVPMRSVTGIIGEHFPGRHIDYVSIDVEGMGASILDSIDLHKTSVDVIAVEMNPNLRESRNVYMKLDKLGYDMQYAKFGDGSDFLFYKKELF